MRHSMRRRDVLVEVIAHPGVTDLTFEKAVSVFVQGKEAKGCSRVALHDYKTAVNIFLRYMVEKHDYIMIADIAERDILEWLAYLRNTNSSRGKPYSSRSIQTYCRHVLVFFQWLLTHEYIVFNPAAKIKEPKVDKPLIRVFTDAELEKLDAACTRPAKGRSITPDERKMLTARDRAIFWLLLSTGIRLSELCGLRFMDMDWDKGMINVHGKGAKERRVPMGQVARQHLNIYITYWRGAPANTEEAVFINVFGSPVTPPTVK